MCKERLHDIWTSSGVLPWLQRCKVPTLHSTSFLFKCLLSVTVEPLASSHWQRDRHVSTFCVTEGYKSRRVTVQSLSCLGVRWGKWCDGWRPIGRGRQHNRWRPVGGLNIWGFCIIGGRDMQLVRPSLQQQICCIKLRVIVLHGKRVDTPPWGDDLYKPLLCACRKTFQQSNLVWCYRWVCSGLTTVVERQCENDVIHVPGSCKAQV